MTSTYSSRFEEIQDLLKTAAGGDAAAFAGVTIWDLPYERLLATKLVGLPLIEATQTPAKSCCGGTAKSVQNRSALLLGLRGEQPFDGSQFPRLPWGRPPLAADSIALVEEWIADGAPQTDPGGEAYAVAQKDWTTDTAYVEVKAEAYSDVAAEYAEYTGLPNEYKFQNGELRQRMNIDCMTEPQLEQLRFAFREMYALNSWPQDVRSYNNMAMIHQNHCQHGWERFLPWHRAYLYEFEQVLQDLCPGVTMPYWDWTMPQYRPANPDRKSVV